MRIRGSKKKKWLTLFCVALCLSLFFIPAVQAKEPQKTIRVAYPIQAGATDIDEGGNLIGYTYEYLKEVAQYTGWNYEFVRLEGDINTVLIKMMDMLEKGELDIMGMMNYSNQLGEIYDYPGYSYGSAYTTLLVPQDSELTQSNYRSKPTLRVAVKEKAKTRIGELNQFAQMNGLHVELVYIENEAQQMESLKNGTADALISRDVNRLEGMRTIAKFSPQPYYFAVTKGNTELVTQLDQAIQRIDETDPFFSVSLYQKYFGYGEAKLAFSDRELAYIKNAPVLRVGIDVGKAPIQFIDTTTGKVSGISSGVFEYIHEKTGLQFEVVPLQSQEALSDLLNKGALDLAGGIPYDYDTAESFHVALSRPYLSSQITMILNNRITPGDTAGKRLALPRGMVYEGIFVGDVVWYDSIEQCIGAVAAGAADYSYGNSFSAQFYTDLEKDRNVTLLPQSNQLQELSIGVAKPIDIDLLTILNKTIHEMTGEELQAIIYRSTASPRRNVTFMDYVDSNPRQIILVGSLVTAAIIAFLAFFLFNRIRSNRRIVLDNERYRQLSDLSNEYLFEYDFRKDLLLLTEKCAEILRAPQILRHFWESMQKKEERANECEVFIALLNEQGGTRELHCALPDGSRKWIRTTVKILLNKSGLPIYSVGKIVDIQAEVEQRTQLEEKAQNDSLTGVYNAATTRLLVTKRLLCANTAHKRQYAVFILDIDRFKDVNDLCGHFTGDLVLKELAEILKTSFRKEDILGRIGGDEFLIYMQDGNTRIAEEKCRLLQEKMRRLPPVGQVEAVTLSIGVLCCSGARDYDEIYQAADDALYEVKKRGRNGFEIKQ